MKEKDRYEVTFDGLIYDIFDNEMKQLITYLPLKEHYKVICALLNQQDARIKKLEKIRDKGNQKLENFYNEKINELDNDYKQSQKQLAISALEEVNSILTNIIIEVTEYEMNLDKLCYLEEISYEFGQAIKNKVEGLKK